MKTLINYFKEIKAETLDRKSKEILYKTIFDNIQKWWYPRTLSSRLKYIKTFAVLWVFVLTLMFWYIYNPDIYIHNIRFWSIAQADYIWTVVSWNGSYQIIDNEHNWNSNSITQIPKWWSLVVEWWSEVSVKTSNNAFAKVVWPAKVTFIKKDNQIIVDVSYSNSIHIEKKSHESLLAVNTDVLIVKTESKTIIWKTPDLNLSLSNGSWEKPLLTSLGWELIISDDLWKLNSISIKEKDSVLLDSELKLFAVADKKTDPLPVDRKKDSVVERSINNIWNDIFVAMAQDVSWDAILSGDFDPEFSIFSWNLSDSWLHIDSWVLAMNIVNDDIIEEKNLFLDTDKGLLRGEDYVKTMDPIALVNNESELQKLLYVKPILDGKLLELIDKLYESYYYTYNKDIFKVKDLIFSLCDELRIQCDENNLIRSLNQVNGKVINTYVITPDIKLVQ